MYLDHFQLKTKPFQITADPKFLWLGEKHKEALATLRYGILDNRGFLLLTGEVGTGKTILINRLVSLLEIDTVVATLPDPDLESMDFYNLLADGFKMNKTFDSKGAFLIHLRDFLHQSHAKQQQVLLVIDESQRLNHHLMEDIRVLSNIELHDAKLINIFFVGQQEFNSILLTPQNRALAQRITVRYHIEPLDQKETGNYINHRLKVAGSTRKLFSNSAIFEIYQFSGGIPRLINIICDHALLTGYARGIEQVDDKVIIECAGELRIPSKYSETGPYSVQSNQHVPNTMAIANATNKVQAEELAAKQNKSIEESKNDGKVANTPPRKSKTWILAYIAMIFMLVAIVAFAITYFTNEDRQLWEAEDLTPQKYKTSLAKEKEILENKLKAGAQLNEESPVLEPKNAIEAEGPAQNNEPDGSAKDDLTNGPPLTLNSMSSQKTNEQDSRLKPGEKKVERTGFETGEIEPLPLIKETIVVHFGINSNEIENESYAVLDRISSYMVKHPKEIANVRGYTDSSGSSGYNESVSMFRANAVKSYLVGKGVRAESINTFAMSDKNPMATNDTLEGRRQNRRVEIEFLQSRNSQGTESSKPPL